MAAIPDSQGPGDDLTAVPSSPDQTPVPPPDQTQAIQQAVGAGYSWQDIVGYHADQGMDPPARPALGDIYSDGYNVNQPGVDAINEGAGPVGEAVFAAATGGAAAAVKGIVAGAADVAAVESGVAGSSRAAQMGVQTSTDTIAPGTVAPTLGDDIDLAKRAFWKGTKYFGGAAGVDYVVRSKDTE